MAMVNVTPRKPSVFGIVLGSVLTIVGVYLLYLDFAILLTLLKIFAGFFLLLFGLGILTASAVSL